MIVHLALLTTIPVESFETYPASPFFIEKIGFM